jgi:hypothetical protein
VQSCETGSAWERGGAIFLVSFPFSSGTGCLDRQQFKVGKAGQQFKVAGCLAHLERLPVEFDGLLGLEQQGGGGFILASTLALFRSLGWCILHQGRPVIYICIYIYIYTYIYDKYVCMCL